MTGLARALDVAYRAHQSVSSAWAERRHARDFDTVEGFVLFVGYPRSGHSLVGAMLNAHRNAVISHELDAPRWIDRGLTREQLYARILTRARWFHLRGDRSNYRYRVPGEWQGRFDALRVIGDKRGGAVTRRIARDPDFLVRIRALVGVPLRLIHVVRNPFDNIAAISLWHELSLDQSVELYFEHCRTTASLAELTGVGEVTTIHHEELVRSPRQTILELCSFVGLAPDDGYVDACARIVFERPTFTRRRVAWSALALREVERRSRSYPFLASYDFDDDGGPFSR